MSTLNDNRKAGGSVAAQNNELELKITEVTQPRRALRESVASTVGNLTPLFPWSRESRLPGTRGEPFRESPMWFVMLVGRDNGVNGLAGGKLSHPPPAAASTITASPRLFSMRETLLSMLPPTSSRSLCRRGQLLREELTGVIGHTHALYTTDPAGFTATQQPIATNVNIRLRRYRGVPCAASRSVLKVHFCSKSWNSYNVQAD